MSQKSKFYVYSKKGCGFCTRLTEFLESKDVGFEKLELGEHFSSTEFVDKFGNQATFPQVHYENQKIGGMKDTIRYLVENDYV